MIARYLKTVAIVVSLLSGTMLSAMAQDTLVVGVNVGNVPWEFMNNSGDIVGFEVDLVNAVTERLGATVEFQNIPLNDLFPAVQSGRIDIAMSSISITNERLETVSFAQPYYDSDQSLATATGGAASLDEMKDKVVGVDTGSTGDMWATENSGSHGFADIRRYEGLASAMLDLAAGRIDGYISDIPALLYYVKDKPDLQVVQRIETGEKYSMMFAKDAELASKASDVLSELKVERVIAELHEKWFGAVPEDTTSTVQVLPMPTAR